MIEKDLEKLIANRKKMIDESLDRKLPFFIAKNSIVKKLYNAYIENKLGPVLNEKIIQAITIPVYCCWFNRITKVKPVY